MPVKANQLLPVIMPYFDPAPRNDQANAVSLRPLTSRHANAVAKAADSSRIIVGAGAEASPSDILSVVE